MRTWLPALFVGVIFGAGLTLSDMVNPARVQAFLDVAGDWDPSLALVMAAAIVPSSLAYRLRRRMARPFLADRFAIPENRSIDRRLTIGATLFGVGWGLAGFCPGPAIASLIFGGWQPLLFVAAMVAGMAFHWLAFADTSASTNHA